MKTFARVVLFISIVAAHTAAAQIRNITQFLDQCPQNDPALSVILEDFTIRRNGVIMTAPPPCSEPVRAMPTSAYTDELIALQTLRAIYYMDRGQSGHLPWTTGTMYEWMKSRVGGIDIHNNGPFAYCCNIYDAPLPPPPGLPAKHFYVALPVQDDFNRDFDRTWRGMSGQIALVAHEVRHRDGSQHTSCCGISGGCDDTFDPANLSSYGTQWWLAKLWLDGTINVGMGCLSGLERLETASWLASDGNDFAARFCQAKPDTLRVGTTPGGLCPPPPRRRAVRR